MLNLQLAKDTFYAALRDRVAAGNPARTIVVRGQIRPGVLVAENELPGAAVDGIAPPDAFCLRWTALAIAAGALPLVTQTCEIRYATDGTAGAAGMDRGRTLAAMDAELSAAICAAPQSAGTLNVAEVTTGAPASALLTGTNIFWGDILFKPATLRGERMERTAEIEVFSYGQ